MLAINKKILKSPVFSFIKEKIVFTQKSNINRRVKFLQSYCIIISTSTINTIHLVIAEFLLVHGHCSFRF